MEHMTVQRGPYHIPGASRHPPPDKEFRTEHIALQVKIDLDKKQIAGSCKTRLIPVREGIVALHLDAVEMKVSGVTLDGVRVPYEHDGRVLTVSPPGPLAIARHELRVDYSAEPKQGLFFIAPDDKFPKKRLQAWTHGEPEYSRHWFPCHDHPNDKSTSEMAISVPQGYMAISNGKLVSKQDEGGWTTYRWREEVAHSAYLNSLVVGEFGVIEETAEGVPLQYYFPEAKRVDARRLYGQTPEMLKVFESLTRTKYPYEKYAQVAVQDFAVGGMENISATTLTDTRFPDERSEEDYAARYSRPDRNHIELVAHELAHMWFGDLVTAKHWSHLWLNEGFATYFQALYTREKYGEDEFRHDMMSKAEVYFEEDANMYRRAIVDDTYVFPDDVFDSYNYEKAAWMIHQLRYILGDDLFFDATSEFLKRFAKANADTHDYMNVLEEKSGLSLEPYFEQAFYKGGHPEFEVGSSWDEATKMVTVTVKQSQKTDAMTPVFDLPCDIAFYIPGAPGSEKDGGRQLKRVRLSSKEERFHFELPWKPTIIEFDPEERLLKKVRFEKPVSMLLSQLEASSDASSRRRAAEELSSFKGDFEVVQSLERTVRKDDQHFGVRCEAAKSLGKIGSKDALDALLGLAAIENRRVRRAVVAALGEFRDERVAKPLAAALKGDASPYVQCQAALSYAKARLPGAFEVVTSAVGTPSPEEAVTEACLEALGYVKEARSRAYIRRYVPYGSPLRARVGALKGLLKLGHLEEEDVATLRDILREDKEFAVRSQVLEMVSELLDARFSAAVDEAAQSDPDPRNRRRAMEVSLRLADSSSVAKALSDVRDDLAKVRSENRELRERFSSAGMS